MEEIQDLHNYLPAEIPVDGEHPSQGVALTVEIVHLRPHAGEQQFRARRGDAGEVTISSVRSGPIAFPMMLVEGELLHQANRIDACW